MEVPPSRRKKPTWVTAKTTVSRVGDLTGDDIGIDTTWRPTEVARLRREASPDARAGANAR